MIEIGNETYYYTKICLNGHVLSNSLQTIEKSEEFCDECGKKIIYDCQECNNYISGNVYIPHASVIAFDPPLYCKKCGKPFPWTKARIDAIKELIDFEKKLSKDKKETLYKNMDDILNETPRTKTASIIFKQGMTEMEKEGSKILKDLLIALICETAKGIIFGTILK